ncbi:hypothetical protein LCGC14_3006890, partial [marine sediment metagenome]
MLCNRALIVHKSARNAMVLQGYCFVVWPRYNGVMSNKRLEYIIRKAFTHRYELEAPDEGFYAIHKQIAKLRKLLESYESQFTRHKRL